MRRLVTVTTLPELGRDDLYFRVTSVDAAASSTLPLPANPPAGVRRISPAWWRRSRSTRRQWHGEFVGMGNHRTISGATWTSAGALGGALSFDGVSNRSRSPTPVARPDQWDDARAWVRPAALAGWQTIFYKERPAPDGGLSWGLYASDNNAPPALYAGTAANPWGHITGASLLTVNTWAHVAGTYDGTTLRLYVDGTLVRSAAFAGNMLVSSGPLRIGGNSISLPFGGQ